MNSGEYIYLGKSFMKRQSELWPWLAVKSAHASKMGFSVTVLSAVFLATGGCKHCLFLAGREEVTDINRDHSPFRI
jgi:hypothetical protein